MTKKLYTTPSTEIVLVGLVRSCMELDLGESGDPIWGANRDSFFDDLDDVLDHDLQSNSDKGGLWDE